MDTFGDIELEAPNTDNLDLAEAHSEAPLHVAKLYRLSAKHQEIARRLLVGESQTDIARSLRMSSTHVSNIVNSPLFKAKMAELQAGADQFAQALHAKLLAGASEAVDLMVDLVVDDEAPTQLRLKAALALVAKVPTGAEAVAGATYNVQVNQQFNNMSVEEAKAVLDKKLREWQGR